MNIIFILTVTLPVLVGIFISSFYIILEINNLKKDIEFKKPYLYDEWYVKGVCEDTVFRIEPFTRSDGEQMWEVRYKNPGWEKWTVCRCEKTYDEAYEQMMEIINRLKK